jgi:hypothetical protein
MTTSPSTSAEKTVDRARRRAEQDERERSTSPSATNAAAARVEALRQRTGVRRFVFENGLSLAAVTLFALSFVGQIATGFRDQNAEHRDHGKPPMTITAYLTSGAFVEATAENWESEFLQMGLFVLLTGFLYQRGSSESKRIEEPEAVDEDPSEAKQSPETPWPVRQGGRWLGIYKYSLSGSLLLLFLISFGAHVMGSVRQYNEQQLDHGGRTVTTLGYLATSRLWFESFQNWQSEFFSVAVLVLLSIWLRQQGSPQSKPVAAPASDTGE